MAERMQPATYRYYMPPSGARCLRHRLFLSVHIASLPSRCSTLLHLKFYRCYNVRSQQHVNGGAQTTFEKNTFQRCLRRASVQFAFNLSIFLLLSEEQGKQARSEREDRQPCTILSLPTLYLDFPGANNFNVLPFE